MDRQQSESGLWEDSVEKLRDSASHLVGQAREGLEKGKQAALDLETAVVSRIQERPAMILGAGLALLGLVVAFRLYRRHHLRQFHDW